MRAFLLVAVLAIPLFAGCFGEDDTLRVAFVAKDTATAPHEGLDQLASFLADETGRPVKVSFFTSSTAALQAVAAGQADVASVDGAAAWLAWQRLDLDAIAAEVRADGRTYYNAAAWVRADSDILGVEDFQSRTSCHTGATKSAGMFMPMGYLVQEGYIDATQYPDDISQVQEMARDFFDNPIIGGAYEGYNGALRCLSDGTGDIAFIRDTTPADECTPGTDRQADNAAWCLELADYRKILDFGQVPEHAFMVGSSLEAEGRAELAAALLALNDSDAGHAILKATFGTGAIAAVTTQDHLGSYGSLIGVLPGIEGYAQAA